MLHAWNRRLAMIVVNSSGAALALLLLATPLAAQQPDPRTWTEEKCARYRSAWVNLLSRRGGTQGLGTKFVASHEAFLASGCTRKGEVCPQSGPELDVANMLVIAAMNAGTASTFLPFACPKS
jgi:hypothetical protein